MHPNGGWKSVADVEIAVAEYVDWFNHRRLHGEIGLAPPAEFEANHWAHQRPASRPSTTLSHPSRPGQIPSNRGLHETRADSL